MGGGISKLSELAIKAFAKKATPGTKLADGGGLHLFITPAGFATWRVKYRAAGKERLYSIGAYPAISLAAARAELGTLKVLLAQHKDPVAERRLQRAEGFAASDRTFGVVSEEWLSKKKAEWGTAHYTKSARAFERDVLPHLGLLPIAGITTAMVSLVVERTHNRNAQETAKRILTQVVGVFRYAMAKGWCRSNPATECSAILPRKNEVGREPFPFGLERPSGSPWTRRRPSPPRAKSNALARVIHARRALSRRTRGSRCSSLPPCMRPESSPLSHPCRIRRRWPRARTGAKCGKYRAGL